MLRAIRRGRLTWGAMANKSTPMLIAAAALMLATGGGAASLRGRVTPDAMMAHLTKLQDIAKANGNTRAVGTPGYDASVDYVVGKLRDKGFEVQTVQFDAHVFHSDPGSVTVADKKIEARALEFSLATPPVGVTVKVNAALPPALTVLLGDPTRVKSDPLPESDTL